MRCLRRAPLDLICREFLQIGDAGLEPFDGLALTDIAIRALMMMTINTAITGSTSATIIGGRTKVMMRVAAIVVCLGGRLASRCREVCRLMVLRVVHFFIL